MAYAGLAYDDSGTGDRPAIVLLHGWATRRTSMRPIFDALRTSYRVINVDLPGHGDSPVPDDEDHLAVPVVAQDIAALCAARGITSAVLVGHSFGGAIALELAAQRPDLVEAVVAVEGILFTPAAIVEQSAGLFAALRSPAWREVMTEVLTAGFLPSDDQALLQRLIDEMQAMPQHVVAAIPNQVLRWNVESAAKTVGAAGTPLLCIEGPGGLADLDALRERCPQLVVGKTVGVGHDQMLETPTQTVAMISAFLAATLDHQRSV